jgi:large-conductance mechanosensitive channel
MPEKKRHHRRYCAYCLAPLKSKAKRCSYCHKRVLTWPRFITMAVGVVLVAVTMVLLIDLGIDWYKKRSLEIQEEEEQEQPESKVATRPRLRNG